MWGNKEIKTISVSDEKLLNVQDVFNHLVTKEWESTEMVEGRLVSLKADAKMLRGQHW